MSDPRRIASEFDIANIPDPVWHECPHCGATTTSNVACFDCLRMKARGEEARDMFRRCDASIPDGYRLELTQEALGPRGIMPAIIDRATYAITRRYVVIYGAKSGLGKSSLAGAMLRTWSKRNNGLALWVPAFSLCGSDMQLDEDFVTAAVVVIDDLGNERQMASSLVSELLEARRSTNRATWVTTALDSNAMRVRYGENVSRRVYEKAVLIEPAVRA